MKTTTGYTKGRGDASVHARTRVFTWEDHQLIEIDVIGQLDSEHHFRILGSADEVAALAHELLDAAMKIRAIVGILPIRAPANSSCLTSTCCCRIGVKHGPHAQ
ncbi:hypothetical protein I6G56_00995 (plasmid) [Burkholderia humptydooensis]|uniref:Uncharacterized protein n=1 Tax=Burkholderia humptydooensis TaxID=430531 RepID=A0A7T2TXW1_9BURK|nr:MULTISPECIES: hypothetical protein [Burkholderia]AJY38258.1 hypothetical protein BW21_6247 [Burkholderia sp. 2002721687]QPS41894.1 hypothetical protein I6G56_00995 [Burkholderia humptydooensis]